MRAVMPRAFRRFPTVGIVLLLFAALFLSVPGDDPPARPDLAEARGTVRSVEPVGSRGGIGAVRFALAGESRAFQYLSKAGAQDDVRLALEGASNIEVHVLFDPAAHRPWFEDRSFHTVFALSVGGRPVRSYEQSVKAWSADDSLAAWLGYLAALSGAIALGLHRLRTV